MPNFCEPPYSVFCVPPTETSISERKIGLALEAIGVFTAKLPDPNFDHLSLQRLGSFPSLLVPVYFRQSIRVFVASYLLAKLEYLLM
ncbi:hypothetical protein FS749_002795 [Ceratobasidium sp. UAMH 11750]|nr:hypothetical protein FS749_002795 [Ceratobasidium sp. UAMH 11750]